VQPAPLKVSRELARRFHRRAVLLDEPAADIASVLMHLGYVQIDPINSCGRMHDHILRNRVAGYREEGLMRHLHGDGKKFSTVERLAFEHHLPDTNVLVAFPLDAWPHLLTAMQHRTRQASAWLGRLTRAENKLADLLLNEIAARGPLSSEHINDDRNSRRPVWGASTVVKTTLQKLFFHGRLLIARRQSNRRLYDLPERVLPAPVLALPQPDASDTARWLAILKLRQRRLVMLKHAELARVSDLVQPVAVPDCPTLYCLREDTPLFDRLADHEDAAPVSMLLLAPLDPLIYDRRVTAKLWGFDYTWEVYLPAAKRRRGYYALPLLADTEFVGHVDLKADRKAQRLDVVSRSVRRGHKAEDAIKALAEFLGLKE
jgi:uncharacterized protein YcaQ